MNKTREAYEQNNELKELSKRVEILEKQMKEIKEEKLKELKAELEYAIYLSTL